MKFYLILSLTIVLLFASCNSEKKEVENNNAVAEYYHFDESHGPDFCDTNAIVGGDCGLGDVYLSPRGEAIYNYFCMGQDSSTYDIGTYIKTDSNIVCTFSSQYCYYDCASCNEELDTVPSDPNSGKLHKCETWTLIMAKLNCKTFDYCQQATAEEKAAWNQYVAEQKQKGENVSDQEVKGYSFKKFDKDTGNYFIKTLNKIKALESYLKP